MPKSFLGRASCLPVGTLRASVLIAALGLAGAASAAAPGSDPLPGLGTNEPAPAALLTPDLPGTDRSAVLEPVSSCAELDAVANCMDPALPGTVEKVTNVAAVDTAEAERARYRRRGGGGGWGGRRSGLPWASGASSVDSAFEAWRGRRLDVKTGFLAIRHGWAEFTQVGFVRGLTRSGARAVLGVGLVPERARGQLGACANGAFDTYIRRVGQGLVSAGADDAILRLGWEANRMGDFPWGVLGDGSSYKNCFRRWVQVLRSVPGQSFVFDFNMGARGNLPYSQDNIYPGAEYVDVIGTQRYDRCPAVRSDADWNALYDVRQGNGNPVGLGAWLAWAKAKGKRFSVPEWGVSNHHPSLHCPDNGFDNPFFIEKMYRFFRANAAVMAYESYFNGDSQAYRGAYKIFPSGRNPRAAARYRELWSRGG
ncbi:glycoside hydrolase family 26 protein [Benzoatithermus flavus]|uniref:Glycosyl hydrolase n=1 Tax=Benzoatithermus flavus TaxID=3108223 RepID=A0ABU8XSZ9_9PROT